MTNQISGFGIGGYRSFGESLQLIGPFQKINLFAGQNNSGKSNILSFIMSVYEPSVDAAGATRPSGGARGSKWSFQSLDRHIGKGEGVFSVAFCMPLGGKQYSEIIEANRRDVSRQRYSIAESLELLLNHPLITRGTRSAWFPFIAGTQGAPFTISEALVGELASSGVMVEAQWEKVWRILTGRHGGQLEAWIGELLTTLAPTYDVVPERTLIPAIRRIGDVGSEPRDYSGEGIINRLAQLQNPPHDQQSLKKRFDAINEFLREVVGNPTATLEIPFNRDMVLVHIDNKTLPLSSLGTGTHEVVILAAAATVLQNQIICLEEPELHLHPLLQRKLLKYLQQKTDNQYFITTHSAHFLDMPSAAVFHVRLQDGASVVEPVYTSVERSVICADLGYRASDLVQANCVIWVEGPSDRIYVRHWLSALDRELIEGVHYSIMFYGGRLLSHLTAEDPEVTDFISLRRLNRHISILMDSDRASAHSKLNSTKRRVREEFDRGPGFAWVTAGREIENYVECSILEQALCDVYPAARQIVSRERYDHILGYLDDRGRRFTDLDKIKVAHRVADYPARLDVLDLSLQMRRLRDFIRNSNDMEL